MSRIHITVKGTMVVDVDNIPARVDSVTFDATPDWTKAGTATGVIHGALLTNGQPAIVELNLKPQALIDGSSDTELHFTLPVPTSGVPACTVLHFHVTKTKDGKTVDSNQQPFQVPAAAGATCPGHG